MTCVAARAQAILVLVGVYRVSVRRKLGVPGPIGTVYGRGFRLSEV